ncbi:hypothetical protein B9479_007492 [Cryptococcus floricola]|uniref:Lactam utilization protein lamB n=1 Tax=Cryptococcus floricola TaxID=2591691 RepID=A0A5D3APB6_9TREE|nr:hypothetical protein B9479_007492 [Cryptococcus floricola]
MAISRSLQLSQVFRRTMASTAAGIPRVTINCDMGEGFAKWKLGPDAELMPLIDLANVACGFHAGDPLTILSSTRLALASNVAIGAHPGLDDIRGFGRRKFDVSEQEVYAGALYQIGAVKAVVEAEGGVLGHVKPHGALYFILRDSPALLRAFLKAQLALSPPPPNQPIPFVGLAGTAHESVCKELGIPFIPELFVDIDYDAEGRLLSVGESRKPTEEGIREKVERVLREKETLDINNKPLKLPFLEGGFTICLHSDMPTALDNVRATRKAVDEFSKQ